MLRSARSVGLLFLVACSGEGGGFFPCEPTGPEERGDSIDNDCDGLVDELKVCAAGGAEHTSLAEAIAVAPSGTGIEVCAGVYPELIAIDGKSVHLRGAGAETTILDAGGAGTAVAITGGASVSIEGFTIRGGLTEAGGGGIRCVAAGLELVDSVLSGNRARTGGGLHGEACALHVAGSRFEDNVAGQHGGAVYLAGGGVIEDSELAGNHSEWTGGAVYLAGDTPTIRGTTIRDNTAAHEGGGLYLHQSQALLEDNQILRNRSEDDGGGLRIFESEARLERNTIAGNQAGTDGGGVKISHLPSLFLDNQILDNEAHSAGGGLELDNDSSVVRGGVISGNRASRGGGIDLMRWPWRDGVIEDVRITDNHAWRGGGIHAEDNYQPAVLRRLIIERNEAGQGGGLYSAGGYLVLSNSAFSGNDAGDEGGGLYLGASKPWNHDCPCPPVDPPLDISFIVVHGNVADIAPAIWSDAPGASIESSIVAGHAGTAVIVAPGRAPAWRYNDTHPAGFAGMADPTGSNGNLATEPQFTAAANGDFRLLGASACIDAGNPAFTDPDGSRADMGLHAGPGAP